MEVIPTLNLLLLFFILTGWIYRSWRSLSELKQAPTLKLAGPTSRRGKVSVLIPAKNEEDNIADCIKPFLAQLRDGDEIIVINNCSDDNTEEILKQLGAVEMPVEAPAGAPRLKFKYLNTPKTPEGWTGKNYALHLGIEHASGDWLLFTDADTRHEPGSVNVSLAFAEEKKLDLLTLLPRCLAHGFWEEVIQPCAMAYMGLWFPIRKINDPKSRVYFGNGQYLLMRAEHYRKIGGHKDVKEAFLEDFALMKKTKEMGARGMCAFGMEIYGTRMYESFHAIWRGWRRIFLHAFDQRPMAILKCAVSVLCFSVLPFFLIFCLSIPVLSIVEGLLLAIIFATAATAYAIVKARKRYALLHPLAALVFTAILLDAFQMALFKRQTHWR
ncbi:MAG: glycosyltransferase family A protein [Candidatus Omnitrophica bacterium]|nr:glycosyltransferase family A protein [Candidatus Omnitrophota bacterium]